MRYLEIVENQTDLLWCRHQPFLNVCWAAMVSDRNEGSVNKTQNYRNICTHASVYEIFSMGMHVWVGCLARDILHTVSLICNGKITVNYYADSYLVILL